MLRKGVERDPGDGGDPENAVKSGSISQNEHQEPDMKLQLGGVRGGRMLVAWPLIEIDGQRRGGGWLKSAKSGEDVSSYGSHKGREKCPEPWG